MSDNEQDAPDTGPDPVLAGIIRERGDALARRERELIVDLIEVRAQFTAMLVAYKHAKELDGPVVLSVLVPTVFTAQLVKPKKHERFEGFVPGPENEDFVRGRIGNHRESSDSEEGS